jgi:hypothetical protein
VQFASSHSSLLPQKNQGGFRNDKLIPELTIPGVIETPLNPHAAGAFRTRFSDFGK